MSKTTQDFPDFFKDWSLEWLDPKSLHTDGYQRGVKPSIINIISTNPKAERFQALSVLRRRGKKDYLVDGLQRNSWAKESGIPLVPCVVFTSKGEKHEAQTFGGINDRKPLTATQRFYANLVSGERNAIGLNVILKQRGFSISKGGIAEWPQLRPVAALLTGYKNQGPQAIADFLDILVNVFDCEESSIQKAASGDRFIRIMLAFFKMYPKASANMDRVEKAVRDMDIKKLLSIQIPYDADKMLYTAGYFAEYHYNKGLAKNSKKRLVTIPMQS